MGSKAVDVVTFLTNLCKDYGCPETVTTDGAPNLCAKSVEDMMKQYGIRHRVSSVANSHANSRAELRVKTVKRLLRENTGKFGHLNVAKVSRALMGFRNTPDRDTKLSPAQVLLGRNLRDFLPVNKEKLMGQMWGSLSKARELALAKRNTRATMEWTKRTRTLPDLMMHDRVMIQKQVGNSPKRWDKPGVVVDLESKGFDQYMVKVDGTGRLTRRNRKYLRRVDMNLQSPGAAGVSRGALGGQPDVLRPEGARVSQGALGGQPDVLRPEGARVQEEVQREAPAQPQSVHDRGVRGGLPDDLQPRASQGESAQDWATPEQVQDGGSGEHHNTEVQEEKATATTAFTHPSEGGMFHS